MTRTSEYESRCDAPAGPGQGTRSLCGGRRSAAGGHRPHLGLRPCSGDRHSGQGQDSDADLAVLVRTGRGSGSQPPDHGQRRRIPRLPAALCRPTGRPVDAGQAGRHVPRRVRGARLPDGFRAGRNTRRAAPSAAFPCLPASRTDRGCRSRSTLPRPRARRARTMRTSPMPPPRRPLARPMRRS